MAPPIHGACLWHRPCVWAMGPVASTEFGAMQSGYASFSVHCGAGHDPAAPTDAHHESYAASLHQGFALQSVLRLHPADAADLEVEARNVEVDCDNGVVTTEVELAFVLSGVVVEAFPGAVEVGVELAMGAVVEVFATSTEVDVEPLSVVVAAADVALVDVDVAPGAVEGLDVAGDTVDVLPCSARLMRG